jgi:hypothetical protein
MKENADPPGPAWLRALLGHDVFAEVVYVSWSPVPDDHKFAEMAALPALRVLSLAPVTDAQMELLSQSSSLVHVSVEGEFTDAGVAKLARNANLESLDLSSPHLTAETLVSLRGCKRLQAVNVLSSRPISVEAVEALRREIPGGCDVRATQTTDWSHR